MTGRAKTRRNLAFGAKMHIHRKGWPYIVPRPTIEGGKDLKGLPEDRASAFALYIIETGATVRDTAKKFDISKSTVHMEVIN